MAWGYRNRRRYYRRRYYRRGYGRGATRRAYGNMRAAKQQADNATFTLNVPTKFATFMKSHTHIDGTPALEQNTVGVYPISIYDLLRRSEFFNNYANMYDEFKIDKIKVKLLPTAFTVNTNGNYRSLTVYTAWDRTGLNATQVRSVFDKQHPQNNKIYCTIGEDITTYSSAESRTVNPGANTSITRWLNPKTITEKSQWLSTALLKSWYDEYNDDLGCFTGIKFDGDDYDLAQISTVANDLNSIIKWSACAKDNPCFLLEDPSIKFKPTLLVGVYPPIRADDTTNTTNKIHFNVETEIVCTYRGLRKGKVLSTGEQSSQQLIVGPKPTVIRADGTYNARTDGLDGYSSVTVEVGGDTPEIPENRLAARLTDDVVATAKARTDQLPDGTSLNGFVEWPQNGQIQWVNVFQTTPQTENVKWVDAVGINVSDINLAEQWSQSSTLLLGNVRTTYNNTQQTDYILNSSYPENFNFTTTSDIKYQNIENNNTLVTLRNDSVNCIDEEFFVGDIGAVKLNVSEQDQIQRNPKLNPNDYFVQGEVNQQTGENWVKFGVTLPDGQHSKIVNQGTDMEEQVHLPKLYANRISGYFRMPTIDATTITQPGRYAIGNFEGGQNVLEIVRLPDQEPNANTNTRAVKIKTRSDGKEEEIPAEFTMGTFDINIPTVPEITHFKYKTRNYNSITNEPLNEYFTGKLEAGAEKVISFSGELEDDTGTWLLVYKNNNIYGAWPFYIPQNGMDMITYDLHISNFGNNTPLYYSIIKAADVNDTLEFIQTFGFSNDSGDIVLPLSINTKVVLKNNASSWINGDQSGTTKYVYFRGNNTYKYTIDDIVQGMNITVDGNSGVYYNPVVQYQYDQNTFVIPDFTPIPLPDDGGEDEAGPETNLSKNKKVTVKK